MLAAHCGPFMASGVLWFVMKRWGVRALLQLRREKIEWVNGQVQLGWSSLAGCPSLGVPEDTSYRPNDESELRSAEYSVQQLDRCETLADRRTMN